MFRWHESGCKRPDVSIVDGIPYCNHCFSLLPSEDITRRDVDVRALQAPRLANPEQMNLTWPPTVNYASENPEPDHANYVETIASRSTDLSDRGETEDVSNSTIRLVRLKRGKVDSPIHVDIEEVSIKAPLIPKYEALSYTWADELGDCYRSSLVFCGQYWDIKYVTNNCAKALQAARRQQSDRLLWVDSLCIDYEDCHERTKQTTLVSTIFTKASRVIAYISGPHAETNLAFDFLKELKYRALSSIDGPIQEVKRSLNILFQEPYFSRLWVIQELLLAKEIELISGEHSASLDASCFSATDSIFRAAPWYIRDQSWYGFTGNDLLRILLKASQYSCSDPRDKIFAVLGLIYQNDDVRPAYDIPIECVYTGITAYVVSCCRNMDVLALAGTRYKSFNVPSWVPDWSQTLNLLFPSDYLSSESFSTTIDDPIQGSHLIMFDSMLEFDNEIRISRNTGCMHIRAIRLCDVAGRISRAHDYTNIIMPKPGEQGNLIITIPGITYQIMTDYLYLLSGFNHPVLLRRGEKSGIYSLISVCALSYGPPSSQKWATPWRGSTGISEDGVIKISSFSNEEDDMILHLHSNLVDLYRVPAISGVGRNEEFSPLSTVKNHIMNFSLLVATSLPDIEARLRDKWKDLNRRLRWLFSDKTALRTLMNDINEGVFGQHYGESRMVLSPYENSRLIKFGVEFPFVQRWDLRQFCWSFLTASESDATVAGDTPSPVLEELRSQINQVKSWSEVTGQLLGIFEYTGMAFFQQASVQFPGIQLQQKWYHNYERFCEVSPQTRTPIQQDYNVLLDTTCLWDWSEFEAHLRARETVWGQKVPDGLNPATNTTMAAHLGLSVLGLNLYHDETVGVI